MLINNSGASHYQFESSQRHISVMNGKRTETTEAVSIHNGKGVKEVVKRVGGKKTISKKLLSEGEIQNVMDRKFMPGFFVPCHLDCDKVLSAKSKTRKTKRRAKKSTK